MSFSLIFFSKASLTVSSKVVDGFVRSITWRSEFDTGIAKLDVTKFVPLIYSVAFLNGPRRTIRSCDTLSCEVATISGVFLLIWIFVAEIFTPRADSLTNHSNISKHEFHLVLTAWISFNTSPSFFFRCLLFSSQLVRGTYWLFEKLHYAFNMVTECWKLMSFFQYPIND